MRYAKAFNNKIAFSKRLLFGRSGLTANDYKTDRNNPGSAIDLSTKPYFDGVNLHGNENLVDLSWFWG
ncbi:MAG: hypothetical protein IPO98_14715 [Saprospiraceae bacterium]|nr:hypothetical protein [Saprospiraceae bacterium]